MRKWKAVRPMAEYAHMAFKEEYMEKYKKIMPTVNLIRYFKIENHLQLLREIEIAIKLPLVMTSSLQEDKKNNLWTISLLGSCLLSFPLHQD